MTVMDSHSPTRRVTLGCVVTTDADAYTVAVTIPAGCVYTPFVTVPAGAASQCDIGIDSQGRIQFNIQR